MSGPPNSRTRTASSASSAPSSSSKTTSGSSSTATCGSKAWLSSRLLPKSTNPSSQKPTPRHDRRPPVYTRILHQPDGRDRSVRRRHADRADDGPQADERERASNTAPRPLVLRTTDSRNRFGIAANPRQRNSRATAPDPIWLAGISYGPTSAGWLYLAAMEIIGWWMSDRLRAGRAVDATRTPVRNRRPAPGLIRQSDRGARYAGGDYWRPLAAWKTRTSMSGRGNRIDSAPMESIFGSVRNELVCRIWSCSRRETRVALFEYIAIFHKRRRRISTIGYRTPD